METITRKSMLYKTGVEYGDYTMNHVQGCKHGCLYPCYAFMMAKRFGKVKTQEEWRTPKLVSNTLELLDQEIPRLQGKITSVQLCFSTDPFMENYPEVGRMSIEAIRKLNTAGIKCTVLTKGILPIELSELSAENEYGITLVSLDETFREQYEPYAASLERRIASLSTDSGMHARIISGSEVHSGPAGSGSSCPGRCGGPGGARYWSQDPRAKACSSAQSGRSERSHP